MSLVRPALRLAAAALALSALACQPRPASFDPEDPAIVAQINAAVTRAMEGAAAVDAEKALSVTTRDKDFTFVTGDLMLVGYDEILPRFRDTYSTLQKQSSEIISKRVRLLSPDVAVVTAITEGTYTDKAGFTSEPVGLGSTIIFVRRNGEWRAVHFHQSVAK
jgi:uncharacterized protein (TIGR02246 family)